MHFSETPIHSVYIVDIESHDDERGSFSRIFCRKENLANKVDMHIAQINCSKNVVAGTVRGLHYQMAPASEIKRVTCVRGKVFDIILDLRKESPTFLQWIGIELSADNKKIVHIPKGCAHGFQTLVPHTELVYLHSEPYSPNHYRGIRYNDPSVDIQLPLEVACISERDATFPLINPGFNGLKP